MTLALAAEGDQAVLTQRIITAFGFVPSEFLTFQLMVIAIGSLDFC